MTAWRMATDPRRRPLIAGRILLVAILLGMAAVMLEPGNVFKSTAAADAFRQIMAPWKWGVALLIVAAFSGLTAATQRSRWRGLSDTALATAHALVGYSFVVSFLVGKSGGLGAITYGAIAGFGYYLVWEGRQP